MKSSALAAIQRTFPCELDFLNSIPLNSIVTCYESEATACDSPLIIRLAGQSGSGKSSQLLPAVSDSLSTTSFMHITVGKFAKFHPKYQDFLEHTPQNVRELTNGFALRSLLYFLEHCIKKRMNIVLDLTFLDPDFEIYIFSLAKEYGYRCITNVICMPKRLSDSFISKRADETGRLVSKKTAWYHFSILPVALKAIIKSNIFDEKDRLILWSNACLEPVYVSKHNDSHCMNVLNRCRASNNMNFYDLDAVKKAKTAWLKAFFKAE